MSTPQSSPMPQSNKDLIFVADPMCSWCWGFAPAIAAIQQDFGDILNVSLVLGGLRPGTTEAMTEAVKGEVRQHWEHVNEASGQPFDFGFFERDAFIYDTEPPCRAAVSVRQLKPDAALDFMATLQRSFYAENKDITDTTVLTGLAASGGLDPDRFGQYFQSEEAKEKTLNDFGYARSLGVTGFPTIVARETGDDGKAQYAYLTAGYRPYETLKPLLKEWLAGA